MNSGELFPDKSDIKPIIYAYELVGVESHKGYIKVGETTRSAKYLFLSGTPFRAQARRGVQVRAARITGEECLTLCAGFRVYRARHGEDFARLSRFFE